MNAIEADQPARDLTVSAVQQLAARLVDQFRNQDLVAPVHAIGRPVRLAAIGTIANVALENPLLRDPLMRAGLEPSAATPLADPAALAADNGWDIALVISPYKRTGSEICDRLAPTAEATGVVDTLVRADGMCIGYNTNALAAVGALSRLVANERPNRILLVGTGASARSVAYGVRTRFPRSLLGVVGRSEEGTRRFAQAVGAALAPTSLAAFGADTVIHATTVGESDDSERLEIDLEPTFRPGVRVLDLTNRLTILQRAAISAGCITLSGVLMQLLTNALRVAIVETAVKGTIA